MSEGAEGGGQIDLFDLDVVAPQAVGPKSVKQVEAELPASGAVADPAPSLSAHPAETLAKDGPVVGETKDPQAFRTIGEVSRALAIAPHVLRYWEEQFPMLRPVKRSGARRYYRPEDIALLERINQLVHGEGYTLRGARQLLEGEARQARQTNRPGGRPGARQSKGLAAGGGSASPAQQTPPPATKPVAGHSPEPLSPEPHSPAPLSDDMAKRLRAIRATLADALRDS